MKPKTLKFCAILSLCGGLAFALYHRPKQIAPAPASAAAEVQRVVDWATMSEGASVVEAKEALNGRDVWGLLGKDGGYLLLAEYPYHFVIDLGQKREVRSLYMNGRNWGMWSPDEFTVEYEEEDGTWRPIAQESGWAAEAKSFYIKTLVEPIAARRIRFRAEKGGWHRNVSDEHREYVTRVRRGRFLMKDFSVYPTTRIPALIDLMKSVHQLTQEKERFFADNDELLAASGVQERYAKASARLKEISALLTGKGEIQVNDYDEALALNHTLQEIKDVVSRYRNGQAPEATQKGYLVGALSPLERTRHDLYYGPLHAPVELKSARNEYEEVQLAVSAESKSLEKVRIEISDLISESGAHILSATNVELFRGVFVNTEEPEYLVDYVGKYFDGLVPLERDQTLDVLKGEVQIFWLSYFIPAEHPPGIYKGAITVHPANAEPWTIPVNYTVWNFELPKKASLKNVFSLAGSIWQRYYGKSWDKKEMKYGYPDLADLWVKHRLSPTALYVTSPQPSLETAMTYIKEGANTLNLGQAHGEGKNEPYFKKFLERLKGYDAEVKRRGLEKEAFVYLTDEPFPKDYPEVIARGRRIREVTTLPVYAGLNQSLSHYPEEFKEVIDIWGPTFDIYASNPAWFRERQLEGDQVWWYFVNWGFNVDQAPIRARAFTWITWDQKIDGVMQWAANRYWNKGQTIDHWNARSYLTNNGLANYIYPGPEGQVYPSARLKHMRDGMEDYEYLVLLEGLMNEERRKAKPDQDFLEKARKALDLSSMVPAIATIEENPKLFLERRKILGELISEKYETKSPSSAQQ